MARENEERASSSPFSTLFTTYTPPPGGTASITSPATFFFHATATTEIYTLSLHDALPISPSSRTNTTPIARIAYGADWTIRLTKLPRSEEHTSELQSRQYLVCRLLLEKKKKNHISSHNSKTVSNILHHSN